MPRIIPVSSPLLRSALAGAALLAAAAGRGEAQDTTAARAILGRWSGSSICVKAEWNAACNDETVVYDFVPSDSAGRITLHASKVIAGKPEPMGDLDVSYDPAARRWFGDFDNSRVSIRWIYEVAGSRLTGRVVDRRTLRVSRNVTASR